MNRHEHEELSKLAGAACDGPLSERDQRSLDALLAQSDEARRVWLSYAWLHTELSLQTHAEAALAESMLAIQESLSHPIRDDEPFQELVAKRSHRWAPSSWMTSKTAVWCAGLAALLALAVGLFPERPIADRVVVGEAAERSAFDARNWLIEVERQRRPIATVVQGKSIQDVMNMAATGLAHRPELVLFEGDRFDLTTGEARISMAGGANIRAAAPVSLVVTSIDHVELREGVITAKVPEWATGFVVETPMMKVTDLGTIFTVSANSPDASETRVLEGLVTVHSRKAGRGESGGIVLNQGESVHIAGDRTERSRHESDREQDTSRLAELNQDRAYKQLILPGTGQHLRVGDEDPYWRIVSAPEGIPYATPCYAVVTAEDESYGRNEPDMSQWISLAADLPRVKPNEIYTFESSFDLTGFDHQTVRIQCQVLADNGVRAIRLNGEPLAEEPWVDNDFGQEFTENRFRAILIDQGFIPGRNVIEFDVWNGVKKGTDNRVTGRPNPTALRVEWCGFGKPLAAGAP